MCTRLETLEESRVLRIRLHEARRVHLSNQYYAMHTCLYATSYIWRMLLRLAVLPSSWRGVLPLLPSTGSVSDPARPEGAILQTTHCVVNLEAHCLGWTQTKRATTPKMYADSYLAFETQPSNQPTKNRQTKRAARHFSQALHTRSHVVGWWPVGAPAPPAHSRSSPSPPP